jgi:flavodoxin
MGVGSVRNRRTSARRSASTSCPPGALAAKRTWGRDMTNDTYNNWVKKIYNKHNEEMTMEEFLYFFFENQDKAWLVQEAVSDVEEQIDAFHQAEFNWVQTALEFNVTIVKSADEIT